MNKAILWDLDGTLLYTLQDLTNATNAALTAFGHPALSLEQVRRIVGNGARRQIARALPQGEETPEFEAIFSFYRTYYPQHAMETTRPYPGLEQVLADLQRQGFQMAIISNKPDGATQALKQAFFPAFDLAMGEAPDLPRKPDPAMVLRALERLGVRQSQAVYVGDSEVDVETARNAGIPCISALWGYRDREKLTAAGARYLCAAPGELPETLRKLEQERTCHGQ